MRWFNDNTGIRHLSLLRTAVRSDFISHDVLPARGALHRLPLREQLSGRALEQFQTGDVVEEAKDADMHVHQRAFQRLKLQIQTAVREARVCI